MKKWKCFGVTQNGVNVEVNVEAESKEDAEFAAGEKLIRIGFDPKGVHLIGTEER